MPSPAIYALGFSRWKHQPLRLCFAEHEVRFVSRTELVPDGAMLVVWGMHAVPEVLERGISVMRIEDGFLRSVGLGADLIRPLSWVVDRRGMYFDATRASDLEVLLAETIFPPELLQRAADLRQRILQEGLTKYNVGGTAWHRPQDARQVILVPGQVESDASIARGAPGIKSNQGLLQAVRRDHPEAYVLYKPHPDVVAGLRAQGQGEDEAARWCNEMLINVPMGDLLREVDAVHCLTSLAGFEALLRGKQVTCHGQPFYAGWGLTTDKMPISRRTRSLMLDELVAGALILYPRYMNRKGDALISPEEALDELLAWRVRTGGNTAWWRKVFRMVLRRVVGVR